MNLRRIYKKYWHFKIQSFWSIGRASFCGVWRSEAQNCALAHRDFEVLISQNLLKYPDIPMYQGRWHLDFGTLLQPIYVSGFKTCGRDTWTRLSKTLVTAVQFGQRCPSKSRTLTKLQALRAGTSLALRLCRKKEPRKEGKKWKHKYQNQIRGALQRFGKTKF